MCFRPQTLSIWTALFALGLLSASCSNDLDAESYTFTCSDERPCDEEFRCSAEGICVPKGESADTGPGDTADTEELDTNGDSGPTDTGFEDSGSNDTGPADTGPGDTSPSDTGPADTGSGDSGPTDTGLLDTQPQDTHGPMVAITVEFTGSGIIFDQNRAIDCTSTCTVDVPQDSNIELWATGQIDHKFDEWERCPGDVNGPKCSFVADAAKTARAGFVSAKDFEKPGLVGCVGKDSGLALLEEIRNDNLGPTETTDIRVGAGAMAGSDDEFSGTEGVPESTGHFNIFDDMPFAATHVCIALGTMGPTMQSEGYTLYFASGPANGPDGPTAIQHSQQVDAPSTVPVVTTSGGLPAPGTFMQLIPLDQPVGPLSIDDTWLGAVFPHADWAEEMGIADARNPGVWDKAKLARYDSNRATTPYFNQFEWDGYERISISPVYNNRRPVLRAIRAVPKTHNFELSVDVESTGAAGGTVSSTPGVIQCRSDCDDQFNVFGDVVLEATPNASSRFVGWQNCDLAIGPFCYVTMEDDRQVTAEFGP